MHEKVINLDTSTHETVQRLLPWYVADTLRIEEHDLVREHLATCSQCQADLDWEKKFRDVVKAEPEQGISGANVEQALARLQPQLNREASSFFRNFLRSIGDAWNLSSAGMRAAVALQLMLITGLSFLLLMPQRVANYHTLGQVTANSADLVVMFKPETTVLQMRQILAANSARVVDGPTVTGAYLVTIPASQRTQSVSRLKSETAISIVEALAGGDKH